ncbi:MAG: RNA polymerase sigma factor [Tepidisphaeraceae bacterium]
MEETGPDAQQYLRQPDDGELVRRARGGDAAAFHELVNRHAQPLFGLAYTLLGNAHDAEDVVQETFAGAFRSLRTFEHRSSVRTWLSRILVNQAALHRRRQGPIRMKSLEHSTAIPIEPGSASAGVDAKLDLIAALQKLTDEHRAVIVLREIERMSYDEMAQVLNVPRGTVESRLHRARAELKELLRSWVQ